jgi:pyruvate dehydrogenase E2 component (dihydrolipoamide acetyltransferase)
MVQTVVLPKLGQTVEESTIVKWHKTTGDAVKKGEVLFEMETDKAVLEVESFFEGTLLKILVPEGQAVPVTTPVAFIGNPGEPLPKVEPPKPASPKPVAAAAPARPAAGRPAAPVAASAVTAAPTPAPAAPAAAVPPPRQRVSPRARRLIRDCAIRAEPIPGSGPDGRVTERDVRAYLDAKGYARLRITPAAKNLAAQQGIDILAVQPESETGRLELEDIRRAVAEKPREMSRVRQVIAQRLAQSMVAAPHFYVTVSVDTQPIQDLRRELKQRKINLGLTDFLIKAAALALQEFPAVNSVTDGRQVWWRSKVHIGLAVDLKDALVVPVIRDAARLGMTELHDRAAALVLKAREGKLSPDDMTGGTFTISNMGMLNVENFTAIINPGESAILAVSSAVDTPVVRKNEIVIRPMMKMTLSSDHRLVDGALAARFSNRLKDMLEDTELWRRLTLS